MVPGPLARHSCLHRITISGETSSRYLFHEVENAASFAKISTICKNNYNYFRKALHPRCLKGF